MDNMHNDLYLMALLLYQIVSNCTKLYQIVSNCIKLFSTIVESIDSKAPACDRITSY